MLFVILGVVVLIVGASLTGVGGVNMRKFTETTPEQEKTKFRTMTYAGAVVLVLGFISTIVGFIMRNTQST